MSARRKFDPTREELTRLYHEQGLSMGQIAVAHGVMPTTVRNALIRLEIPLKNNAGHRLTLPGSRALPPLNKELLERMYVRQGRSMADVAAALGCGVDRVRSSLEQHGIPQHETPSQLANRTFLPASTVVQLYRDELWSMERLALYYGVEASRIKDLLVEQGVTLRLPRTTVAPQRRIDHLEEVRVGTTFDGKPRTAVTAILVCGHKHPVHRNTTLRTDMSGAKFSCRACLAQEEKDHG